MDGLTFISQLISALAWPVTVLIIVLILRQPLTNLITIIQRFRFQGIEIDFAQQIRALAAEARTLLPPNTPKSSTSETRQEDWAELARLSPRAVVLEAWLRLEKVAIEAAHRHGITLKSADLRQPLILGRALEDAGVLETNTSLLYHQLRNLRNAAAHASEFAFSSDAALEYADLAARLTEYLQKV